MPSAHTHDDQDAGLGLRQPYAQVDAVGPHVDVVGGRQIALGKRLVIGLPLGGQPRDGGRREPGAGAEELLKCGHEVTGGQAVQIEQRQHLADLRRLPGPGRQDRRGEPLALTGRLVDPPVHARGFDLDRPGRGGDPPGLVVAVAHDQTPAAFVPLIGQLGYVGVDFRLQRGSQHPPGALADDLVNQGAVWCRSVFVDYREHGRAFPTDAPTSAYSMTITGSFGKVRPPRANPSPIHRS